MTARIPLIPGGTGAHRAPLQSQIHEFRDRNHLAKGSARSFATRYFLGQRPAHPGPPPIQETHCGFPPIARESQEKYGRCSTLKCGLPLGKRRAFAQQNLAWLPPTAGTKEAGGQNGKGESHDRISARRSFARGSLFLGAYVVFETLKLVIKGDPQCIVLGENVFRQFSSLF